MKIFISFLVILPICIKMLFANHYQQNNVTQQILPNQSNISLSSSQQLITAQTINIQNNYMLQQDFIYPTNSANFPVSIAQNRDIKLYVKRMVIWGYNDYWARRLDMLMTGSRQKNTAMSHLGSYYTYEKNKYDTYTYHYVVSESTTHWYNYIVNKPITIIYRLLAADSYNNLINIRKIHDVIVY